MQKLIKTYFLQKDESKKLKCRLLQFLFGALRVKLKIRNSHPNIPVTNIQFKNLELSGDQYPIQESRPDRLPLITS